jgi:predicted HicB family RNase H-like nuclease
MVQKETTDDNIEAAMNHVADTLEPTRSPNTNTEEGKTANKQVIVRATEEDHERWKQAAAAESISLSEFIRNCCNKAAGNILECNHPIQMRKTYPWSERCLSCGKRLR